MPREKIPLFRNCQRISRASGLYGSYTRTPDGNLGSGGHSSFELIGHVLMSNSIPLFFMISNCFVCGPNDAQTEMMMCACSAWTSSIIFFGSGNKGFRNSIAFQWKLSPQYCQ